KSSPSGQFKSGAPQMKNVTRRSALMSGAALAAAVSVPGCSPDKKEAAVPPKPAGPSQADQDFAKLAQTWIDANAKAGPSAATHRGDHGYDAEFDDISETGRAERARIVKEIKAGLGAIDRTQLSRDSQVDAAMLQEQVENDAFSLDELKDWNWDPLIYSNIG